MAAIGVLGRRGRWRRLVSGTSFLEWCVCLRSRCRLCGSARAGRSDFCDGRFSRASAAAGSPIQGIVWPIKRSMAPTDLAVNRRNDGDRRAAQACAAGTTDAVDVVVGVVRHVKIEDMADRGNIETARSHVRSDQDCDIALAERFKRSSARRLVHVAMQRRSVELVAQQRAVQLRDLAFAIAEHDGIFESVGRANQSAQRLTLLVLVAASRNQQLVDGSWLWSLALRLRRAPDCAGRCRRCAGFRAASSP